MQLDNNLLSRILFETEILRICETEWLGGDGRGEDRSGRQERDFRVPVR